MLTLIYGCMFSGKTTELISRISSLCNYMKIYKSKKDKVLLINSDKDTRKSKGKGNKLISTHSYHLYIEENEYLDIIKCDSLLSLDQEYLNSYTCIGIDESQFFEDLYIFCERELKNGKYIICSGLSGDSDRGIFGQMNFLIPLCDEIIHKKAICMRCIEEKKKEGVERSIFQDGTFYEACFTEKIIESEKNKIDIGGIEKYIPVCSKHYNSK